MKRIIYTRPDGGVSIVIPAPKKRLEKVLGPLTDKQYQEHVRERSIPNDATKIRSVYAKDIPTSREFRNAWVDTTELEKIDICCEKARDIQLKKLRAERDEALKPLDIEYMVALEQGKDTAPIVAKKQKLRDATNPLKNLRVEGKVNDRAILQDIRKMGVLNV
jgi:hypothetical protein